MPIHRSETLRSRRSGKSKSSDVLKGATLTSSMYSSGSNGFQLRTPNLGGRRGALSDWITQRWVQFTGKRVALMDHPWLEGPVGDVDVIGSGFFERLAEKKNLELVADGQGRGLVEDFSLLRGPMCDPNSVDPRVAMFYENT